SNPTELRDSKRTLESRPSGLAWRTTIPRCSIGVASMARGEPTAAEATTAIAHDAAATITSIPIVGVADEVVEGLLLVTGFLDLVRFSPCLDDAGFHSVDDVPIVGCLTGDVLNPSERALWKSSRHLADRTKASRQCRTPHDPERIAHGLRNVAGAERRSPA